MNISTIISLTPNPIDLMIILCGGLNLFLVFYLLYKKNSNITAFWFIIFFLINCMIALTQAFYSMSNNQQAFSFWLGLDNTATVLSGPIVMFLILSFVGKEKYSKHFSLIGPMAIIVSVFLLVVWKTNYFISQDIHQASVSAWGRMANPGNYFIILLIYYSSFSVIQLLLLFNFYKKTKDTKARNQTRLLIFGFSFWLFISPLIEGFLPSIFHISPFPISIFSQVIIAIVLVYSLEKYGLRVLSVNTVAEKVMQMIPNAVILLDNQKKIEHMNPAAQALFKIPNNILRGQPIKKLFSTEAGNNKFEEAWELSQSRNLELHDIQIINQNGELISVDINGTYINDPVSGSNEYLLIFTSIQAIKDQAKELEQKFIELEQQKVEFENINKLMDDREARLNELKKENEILKNKQPNTNGTVLD